MTCVHSFLVTRVIVYKNIIIIFAILTIFGLTYVCEQLFPLMNLIESTVRNRLGTDLSTSYVQLKSTNYSPRIGSLANKI